MIQLEGRGSGERRRLRVRVAIDQAAREGRRGARDVQRELHLVHADGAVGRPGSGPGGARGSERACDGDDQGQ